MLSKFNLLHSFKLKEDVCVFTFEIFIVTLEIQNILSLIFIENKCLKSFINNN